MTKFSHLSRCFLILIAITLMFSMAACSNSSASNFPKADETVKGFFEALNKSDFKAAEAYCSTSSSDEFKFADAQEEKIAKLMFSKTKYELVSSKEEGNTATVKIKVTNLDFAKIFETMMTDLMTKMTDSILNGEDISDEKAEEMTMKYLEESMLKSDAPVLTKEVDVTLNKDTKKKMWVILDNDAFVKSIVGNVDELLKGE